MIIQSTEFFMDIPRQITGKTAKKTDTKLHVSSFAEFREGIETKGNKQIISTIIWAGHKQISHV